MGRVRDSWLQPSALDTEHRPKVRLRKDRDAGAVVDADAEENHDPISDPDANDANTLTQQPHVENQRP